ncbi:MAG: hypothetical protein R6U31_01905 [bacterium]
MKRYIILFAILPAILSGLNFSGDYNYNYYYYQSINAYGENRITLNARHMSGPATMYIQGLGLFYIGSPRYYIPYPDWFPESIMQYMPDYYALNNEYSINQIYLSLFYRFVNLKIGRFSVKWGLSEVYSPIDIFGENNPINLNYIREGVDGIYLKASQGNNTAGFIYEDHTDYEKTKQGLMFENINEFSSVKFHIAHYFDFRQGLFSSDTIEYSMLSAGIITDYNGPGLWLEVDYFADMDYHIRESQDDFSKYFVTAGIDYTFFDKLYLMGEYIYKSNGKSAPYSALDIISRYINSDFLIGRHYISGIAAYNREGKFSAETMTMLNAVDLSILNAMSIRFNAEDNLKFSLTGLFFTGDSEDDFSGLPPIYTLQIQYLF